MSLRRGLLLGAAGFGLAGLVLKPLGVALIGMPSAAWALVAVAALSVGVLEEGTRAVLLRVAGYPAGRTLAGVALGWGLAELLLVGVAGWVQLRTLAAQPELLTRIAADMPVAAAAALQRQVQAVADGSAWTLAGGLMERLAALSLQIGFTAWVAHVLRSCSGWRRVGGLALAMVIHAAVDVPAAGFQAGLWPLLPVQVAYVGMALVLVPWAWRWCGLTLRPPAPAAASG